MVETKDTTEAGSQITSSRHNSSKTNSRVLSNEKVLFIHQRSSGMALYFHEFIEDAMDPQLLSGFVGAMTNFLCELVGSDESGWKTVYGSESTLMVESGKWAVATLSVSKETSELRSKLRMIIAEFEATYNSLSDVSRIDREFLAAFDDFVMNVFVGDRLTSISRISRNPGWEDTQIPFEQEEDFLVTQSLFVEMDDGITVEQGAKLIRIPLEILMKIVSRAYWNHAIQLDYTPMMNDVLIPSEDSLSAILSHKNPLEISHETVSIAGYFDGRKSIKTIVDELDIQNYDNVLIQLGHLVRMGYVQKTPIEQRLVLTNESILNTLVDLCRESISEHWISAVVRRILSEGISKHPWLSRVRAYEDGTVLCLVDERLSPTNLDDMFDALQHLINETCRLFSKLIGDEKVQNALALARKSAH
ncbi:MAG: hypothetical protein ACW99X_13630 [Candidatus Thorarchaeota archaeon]|jgi:hypothetical protein